MKIAAWLWLLLVPGLAAGAEPLTVTTDGYRPVAFLQDGHPAGALCDVLAEASRRSGIPIEIRFLPWARAMAETKMGRMDAVFPVFRTPERDEFLAFPEETLMTETMAWFSRADSGIDAKDVASHRIGIINQSSYGPKLDHLLHDGTLSDMQAVTDTAGAVRLLTGGRVELIPGFDQGIWAEAKQLNVQDEIRESSPLVDEVPAYLAFTRSRNLDAESQAIDKALHAMKQDGTYASILARYFVAAPH